MEKLPTAATVFCTVALAALAVATVGDAAVVEHTFLVHEMNMTRLCNVTTVCVVNGQLPGPAIEATEGDTVVVHVINKLPHGLTLHWHGVRQLYNCWADGAGYVTECPIPPNGNHTYRFNVTGKVGTLWWHAHVTCLRATIHGQIIIHPRSKGPNPYPYPKPHKDVPIIIGEWWELDLVELNRRLLDNFFFDAPESATINGKLGDLSNCSGMVAESFILEVEYGKTYLLRILNAALFSEYYYKVAGHTFIVVGADANYLNPYKTDIIAIAPGETIDVLMVADATPNDYYMIALANQPTEPDPQIPVFISRGIIRYHQPNKPSSVIPMPIMPNQHNTLLSYYFHNNLTGLPYPERPRVPLHVNERMFVTLGKGSIYIGGKSSRKRRMEIATMNNVSFHLPTNSPSLLELYYDNKSEGVYTEDFPNHPPKPYNYTNEAMILEEGPNVKALEPTLKATKLKRFKYNTSLEIVFQSTALLQSDSNPMHLHGYDFFVLAQGLGNYDPKKDPKKFNLVNPQLRNTIQVPRVGWAAIRFITDNPGMWYLHCHFEFHIIMGMATAFIVENGPTPETSLPPPPANYARCSDPPSNTGVYEEEIVNPTYKQERFDPNLDFGYNVIQNHTDEVRYFF